MFLNLINKHLSIFALQPYIKLKINFAFNLPREENVQSTVRHLLKFQLMGRLGTPTTER